MDEFRRRSAGSVSGCLRPSDEKLQVILEQTDLGSLNHADLEAARRTLAEAVEMSGARTLEVELHTHVIGASFVSILAQVAARLRSRGTRLKLTNVGPNVRRVLTVCGYDWLAR